MKNPKRVQQAAKRLNKEIEEIEDAIYAPGKDDPVLIAGMLERKRDDIVRSVVLQLHALFDLCSVGLNETLAYDFVSDL